MCPGSSDPFYIVTYYIKLVTTSWTHSTTLLSRSHCSVCDVILEFSDSLCLIDAGAEDPVDFSPDPGPGQAFETTDAVLTLFIF